MSKVEVLHNQAMDLAEQAFMLQRRGHSQKAIINFKKALDLERKAASFLPISFKSEPTRSILFKSAASLAYNAKEYDLAERLIANGLAGYPPIEIREELKNLFEDVTFNRHLSLKGLELNDDGWMMSIYGNATKYGGTAVQQLMMRVDKLSKLFYRTIERLLKEPYRTSGGVKIDVKDNYGLYIESFVPRSFAVTFKIGAPNPQLQLWPGSQIPKPVKSSQIIGELFSCFELFEDEHYDGLKDRINDSNYYDNFIGLAKEIAPDGDDIKTVGFTSIIDGHEKPVPLRKRRKGIKQQIAEDTTMMLPDSEGEVSLSGILKRADSLGKVTYGLVQLLCDDGKKLKIHVPIGLMKDVVQPYFEEEVVIQGRVQGEKTILEEISPKTGV